MSFRVYALSSFCLNNSVHLSWPGCTKFVRHLIIRCHFIFFIASEEEIRNEKHLTVCMKQVTCLISLISLHLNRDLEIKQSHEDHTRKILNIYILWLWIFFLNYIKVLKHFVLFQVHLGYAATLTIMTLETWLHCCMSRWAMIQLSSL